MAYGGVHVSIEEPELIERILAHRREWLARSTRASGRRALLRRAAASSTLSTVTRELRCKTASSERLNVAVHPRL